jgi:RHS repeat-associated protein
MRNRFTFPLAFSFLLMMGISRLPAQTATPGPDANPTANTGALKAQIETGGSYDAHSGNETRIIPDLHVPGALGVYGLDFTRYYNSLRNDRDPGNLYQNPAPIPEQPTDFGSPGWSHSWSWNVAYDEYLQEIGDVGGNENYWMSITITFPDGHASKYTIMRSTQWPNGQPWSPDPRFGPPYYAAHGEANWPTSGDVHDYLDGMAQDGSEFWLHRADGGTVHFVNSSWGYQATQVLDPHGLITTLSYDGNGHLYQVEQEGGQRLTISWSGGVISRVENAGSAGMQAVVYRYDSLGGWPILINTYYQNDPLVGQTGTATYTYQSYVPPSGFFYAGPLLATANDPRFAGPMKSISYSYRGSGCLPTGRPAPGFEPYPGAQFDYFYASPTAIAAEKSGTTGTTVSSFTLGCFDGTRTEYNGLGGFRKFFFGRSAGEQGSFHCMGYQLAKLTDFTTVYPLPSNLPFERQNFQNGEPRQIWDARGILTEAVHADGSGFPSEVRHVGSDGSIYHYDRINPGSSDAQDFTRVPSPYHHWLFSKTDERNQTTTYRRDSRRRVTDITHPDGSTEHFDYNLLNQVTGHRLPSGAVQNYHYNGLNQLDREWNSVDLEGAATTYTYYGPGDHPEWTGLVKTEQNARASSSGATYSAMMTYNGRFQVTEVHYPPTPGGGSDPHITYGYNANGYCTWISDELAQSPQDPNHTRVYDYDDYGRCISYTEPLNAPGWNGAGTVASRRWDWIYDRYIDGVGQFGASAHTANVWRIQIEPGFNAAGERKMTARWFDLQNHITLEQTGWVQPPGNMPYNNPNWYWSGDGETHTFTYDENGNKKTYTDPRGRLTTYTYDLRNRLYQTIEPLNRITATQYDTTSNKTLVTFPDNTTQQWLDYDAFGQPGRFIDERANTTNLTYWQWGPMKKLHTVTTHRDRDGGGTEDQPTTLTNNGMGRPIQVLFPDGSYENTSYECTDGGSYFCDQVHTWQTRKGAKKTIQYDARGRESSHSWNDTTPGITSTWDDANRRLSFSNIFSTINYQYDAAAQPLYEKNTIAGSGGQVQTTFYRYANGDLANLVYPAGPWLRHDYTARGQLKTAGVADGSGNWAFQLINYYYWEDGTVNHQDYGNGTGTGTGNDYDARGFPHSINIYRFSPSYQSYSFRTSSRDSRDRIWAWQKSNNTGANPKENGRGDRYVYDAEGQLTEAYYECADPAGNFNGWRGGDVMYGGYDALGNRRGNTYSGSRGSLSWGRLDNGLNQYSWWSPSAIAYEGNGVLTQEGSINSDYNALNQPLWVWNSNSSTTTYFGYDPLGRCVKRWSYDFGVPTTYYYFDGWNLIQEGADAWSPTRLYVHGNRVDEIVTTFNVVTSQYGFHHYELRGHCAFVTDISGNIMEQYEYDAWGKPYYYDASGNWLGYSPFGNRFLFTGREWLSDLGVYDYRNRLYHPELGRFLQPDPQEFGAGDYNLYRYCHNDPINKSDPTGLYWDVQDFSAPDNWKVWQMILKLDKLPGPEGDRFRYIENSPHRMVVIPIQTDRAGQDKWTVPEREPGDRTNQTTPQNPIDNSNGSGIGSRVEFDPNNGKDPDGNPRPPIDALAHEAGGHGYRNMTGANSNDKKKEEGLARQFQIKVHKALKKMDQGGE